MSKVPGFQPGRINNLVKLDSPKVVDTVEIEDIGDKVTTDKLGQKLIKTT